LRWQ